MLITATQTLNSTASNPVNEPNSSTLLLRLILYTHSYEMDKVCNCEEIALQYVPNGMFYSNLSLVQNFQRRFTPLTYEY